LGFASPRMLPRECYSPGSETSRISQRPLSGTSGPGEK
jgi:hypothetical protein